LPLFPLPSALVQGQVYDPGAPGRGLPLNFGM
jgi:hypothetical protein